MAPSSQDKLEDETFVKVDSETPVVGQPQQTPSLNAQEIEEKVRLLRGDLGFDDLSKEAATKMVVQLGGHMNLIVRALIANSKKFLPGEQVGHSSN